jgi:G3E family GTPase
MADERPADCVPISLVTGFLGSGKTTLIAALLKQPAMVGTGIIVNEYGGVGIDDAIFAQSIGPDDVLLLANGCLCCTAGDDLAMAVWRLVQRRERPRRIVIETTGLADPPPVLRRLIGDPRLALATRLDTVVATIDAVSGLDNLEHQPVAERQCAVADRRVITKSDIGDPGAVERLRQRLHALNPGAEILQVDHGRIDADTLLSASLYDAGAGVSDVDRWLSVEAHRGRTRHHDHTSDHSHHSAATWLIEEERPVHWGTFLSKLGPIVGRHGEAMLRVKGVIYAHDDPRPIVIHGVQRTFHPPVRLHSWKSAPGTKIVLIGDKTAEPAVADISKALFESVAPTASDIAGPPPAFGEPLPG